MTRRLPLLLTSLFVLGASWPADAGIYNALSILNTKAEDGLSGSMSGSTDWRTGNIDFFFISGSTLARYKQGKHLLVAIAQAEHKTSSGTRLVTRFFEHLRYRYELTSSIDLETFGQHEFDAVKRLELRTLGGAGPRVDIIDDPDYGLGLGIAYMLEYERLRNDMQVDAGESEFQHRISSYLVGQFRVNKAISVFETVYAQPRITDPDDWRLLSDVQAAISVTQRLTMSLTLSIGYDAAPPATIKRVDSALLSALTLEL